MDTSPVEAKCSGAMTAQHDGSDIQRVSIGLRATRTMCRPCREAAGRMGLIDNRVAERRINTVGPDDDGTIEIFDDQPEPRYRHRGEGYHG